MITKLIKAGTPVEKGDLVVEFDRQTQLATALDRRAELNDLEQQIKKKDAGERAARSRDDGEILLAESALSRAKLETVKNELLPKIQAEKNNLAVEQATATLNQLKETYALKRKAAEADLQILKIRRDRAESAMRQAETNAERMAVVAPISGMAVLRTVWKANTMAEVQEGEEVRAGVPVVDVVNPKTMRVRARVNQADINELQLDQPVKIGLDAYPELSFDGRIAQISPLGVVSTLSPKARVYVVLIQVNGSHPKLMPDLTASLDVTLSRLPGALVVPRDAVGTDGKRAFVRVQRGSSYQEQTVTVGADECARRRPDVRRRRRRRRREEYCASARRKQRRRTGRAARGWTMMRRLLSRLGSRKSLLTIGVLVLVGGGLFATVGRGSVPDVPTADVTRGEFVDALELRGEIRPLKSIVLSSPMQSGELQILKLAANGSKVKAGDIVVQFDGTTLQRTIQEKQSELKQANAEIEQANAQARIANEQNATALMKAKYDIERAKLDINKGDTVSRIENEQAKLSLGDAEQRLKELEEKMRSDRTSAEADLSSKVRKREKAIFDLKRAEDGLERLQVKAPTDGVVNVLPNYRSGNMMGSSPEFRQGDRAWAGAAILELPDLSSVHLLARLDESDRSRLEAGQAASVRIEAVPGNDFKARIDSISMLARVDYQGTWPPPRNFDLDLVLLDLDPRIRPGMTAVARIATERIPNVVLIPSEAIFQRDGASVVYELDGSEFQERRVQITKRGKEQAVVASGIELGDRIATRRPSPEMIRRSE